MLESPAPEDDKQSALRRLLEALRGFEVVAEANNLPPGMLLQERRTGRRLAVEVKVLCARRANELPAALALASYQFKEEARRNGAEPLVVFALPQWNPSVVEQLRTLCARFDLGLGWAVLSDDGGFAASLPAFRLERSHGPRAPGVKVPRIRQSVDPFTDANRWMLKLLLLRDVDMRFWGGPRGQFGGVQALSRAAGVTAESAYRFVRSLQANGFAKLDRGAFELVETGRLLMLWLGVDASKPLLWQPVRWTRGKPDDISEVFGRDPAGPRYAVTNYEGCRRLGLLHATVPGIDIQVEADLEDAMRRLKLEPAAPHESHFRIARARFPRSVFGGAVVANGVAISDALQLALDVRSHPARGVEQSDYIIERLQIEQ